MKAGYITDIVKINNLLFMDDLELFSKNEKEISSLKSTVQAIRKDIGMEFGIQTCSMQELKRRKATYVIER